MSGSAAIALRKASWRLLPILGAGYAVALIDRTNLSFAALQMNRDLGFSASTYGFGAGIFFLSYAGCNLPANLLLLRFGARRWLSLIMAVWGILSGATVLVHSPLPFYALRFLLGMAEAGFFPGVIYYLTRWFPPDMRARAITRFYVFGPLSGVIMGALAGVLLGLNGRAGLAGWQWLFLLEAFPSFLLAAAIAAFLPNGPEEAGWLSEEERSWLLQSREAYGNSTRPPASFFSGLADLRVWLAGLFMFWAMFSMYGYVFFAPLLLERLTGAGASAVGWMVAAQYVVSALAMVLNGAHSDRRKERLLHAIVPTALSAAGFLLAAFLRQPWLAVAALSLILPGLWAAQGPTWAACTGFLRGDSAAAGIGAITSFGILGGFVGPLVFGRVRDWTGDFHASLGVCALAGAAGLASMAGLARALPSVSVGKERTAAGTDLLD